VRWTGSGDVVIRWELGVHEVWKRPSDRRERIRGRENRGWGREQSRIIYILRRRRREGGGGMRRSTKAVQQAMRVRSREASER